MCCVQRLWPPAPEPETAPVDEAQLAAHYALPGHLSRPYVRSNFVTSADGAVTLQGQSGGLSDETDQRVFVLLRALADVVLVGAGTARAEGYRGARRPRRYEALRAELGLAPVPPIAVVTRSARIDPAGPLLTEAAVAPLVLTCAAAPAARRTALERAGAQVHVVGDAEVDIPAGLDVLARLGLLRVLCEGGPQLFAELVAADAVDELCVTLSPVLVGGGHAGRISDGRIPAAPRALRLDGLLHAEGSLLLRYRRNEHGASE